jgi:hypothetical protein
MNRGSLFDYDTLKVAADGVLSLFSGGHPLQVASTSREDIDDFTFHHSVNVSMLTTLVAARLVKNTDDLRRITIAALLHDVGKSRIPAEIIYKPGPLTPAEADCLRRHPALGAEILLAVEGMDPLAVTVAFCHHMSDRKESYPRTRKPIRRDWVTKLVSVADVYESLTSVRPYKAALPSESAFRLMLEMPGMQDCLGYVKLLFEHLGPYPPGTMVELSSGEWAMVLAPNSEQPYRPRVRVLTDPGHNRLDAPRDLDLAAAPAEPSADEPPAVARLVDIQSFTGNLLHAKLFADAERALGGPLADDAVLMAREG